MFAIIYPETDEVATGQGSIHVRSREARGMLCGMYMDAYDPRRDTEGLTWDVVQECGSRFRASEAIQFIVQEFYNGPKKLWNQDKAFITRISGPFICLIFSVLHHTLQCFERGEYVVSGDYNYQNSGGT